MSVGTGLDAVVAALPAVDLDTMTADAALLTRVDRKYVVPVDDARRLLASMGEIAGVPAALEIDGQRELAYRSVYFDTPDLLSYRLAARGRRRRFKLRTRTYIDTGAAYLELKTRGARGLTLKERGAYDPDEADRLTSDAREEVAVAFGAIGVDPARADELDARMQTMYRRATLLWPGAAGDASSRSTIDTNLRWADADGAGFMLPRFAVIETKTDGRPGALDRALWRAGHRPQRISKYATGMAAMRVELPRNRWHRVLTGAFASSTELRTDRKDATCDAD
ncbi:polyphosphate polymerase domain-containing protein [Microbacterium binotii]|uniref:polyphosphate polymerase domain-containing protein n=1 Tax=Microbacterium binotii TaxID=462710 RepID=UPI001F1AA1B2|nr:polyphosphate polymerase domain-containing protein [Microbacterium binotii]UIN31985.1 polyphosphate polymerase domain-containing protein [Microbacterium binotii]